MDDDHMHIHTSLVVRPHIEVQVVLERHGRVAHQPHTLGGHSGEIGRPETVKTKTGNRFGLGWVGLDSFRLIVLLLQQQPIPQNNNNATTNTLQQ